MPLTSARFASREAPCGQVVEGERYQDRDEECLLTDELSYSCGCQSVVHEYHDGSMSQRVVRHDGVVLLDELLSAE